MMDSVSIRVVTAVAETEGVDHTDLPPLHDVIDADALDAVVEGYDADDGKRGDLVLRFSYAGHTVLIRNGEVTVDPIDVSTERRRN